MQCKTLINQSINQSIKHDIKYSQVCYYDIQIDQYLGTKIHVHRGPLLQLIRTTL